MDPHQITLYILRIALRWPTHVRSLLSLYPILPYPQDMYNAVWEAVTWSAQQGDVSSASAFLERILSFLRARYGALVPSLEQWMRTVQDAEEPNEASCIDLVKSHLRADVLTQTMAGSGQELDFLTSRMEEIMALGTASRQYRAVDLFGNDGRDLLIPWEIEPTGFEIMDGPFGGLFPAGLSVAYVVPTKSGKTTYCIQLSKHMVENGRSVLYLHFEETARGQLSRRIYTVMTDSELDVWMRTRSFEDLPEDVHARLNEVRPQWEENFTLVSASEFSENPLPEGVRSMNKLVDDLYTSKGKPPPDLIVLDWWRNYWQECYPSLRARFKDILDPITEEKAEFKRLRLLGASLNSRVVVMLQTRADLARRAFNIDRVNSSDTSGNKGLAEIADATMVATTIDPATNVVIFKLDLCRFSQAGWQQAFRLDGDHCMFVSADTVEDVTSQFDSVVPPPGAMML